MTRSYPKSSQIVNDSALSVFGIGAQTPLDTLFSKIAQDVDFPYRLYSALVPDSKLYITSSAVNTGSGTQEVVTCSSEVVTFFATGYVDFQARAYSANISITFPTSTVGYYRYCTLSAISDGTLRANFTSEAASILSLPDPLSVKEINAPVLGWVLLECTATVGEFKTAGSATNIIESAVGGNSRIFQFTDRSFASHLLLANINGGTYGDGGHDNLVVGKIASGAQPTSTDDVTLFKNSSLWADTSSLRGYVLLDNTDSAAIWKEFVFNGGNSTELTLGTTSSASLIFKTNNVSAGQISNAQVWSIGPVAGGVTHSVSGNLVISGDLTISGTTTTVNSTTVNVADNQIVLNHGEAGAGVTAGQAGILVDRGSATNYEFIFRESDDLFRIGLVGSTQAVATREDTPLTRGVPFWNATDFRFDTDSGFTYNHTSNTLTADNMRANVVYLGTSGPYLENASGAFKASNADGQLFSFAYTALSLGSPTANITLNAENVSILSGNSTPILTLDAGSGIKYRLRRAITPQVSFAFESVNGSNVTNHISVIGESGTQIGAAGNHWHHVRGTGALSIPTGTTTDRVDLGLPGVNGVIRFNTTTSVIEYMREGVWLNVASEPYAVAQATAYSIVFG